jgi:hypothetical protein
MGGQVIHREPAKHRCLPGWTSRPATPGPPFFLPPGTMLSEPPRGSGYPPGTVWQCDCGKTWVSRGPVKGSGDFTPVFQPEGRFARRRRERRSAKR